METQHVEPEIVEKLNGTWVFDQEATRDALGNDAGMSAWDKGIFLETLLMVEGSEISFSAGQAEFLAGDNKQILPLNCQSADTAGIRFDIVGADDATLVATFREKGRVTISVTGQDMDHLLWKRKEEELFENMPDKEDSGNKAFDADPKIGDNSISISFEAPKPADEEEPSQEDAGNKAFDADPKIGDRSISISFGAPKPTDEEEPSQEDAGNRAFAADPKIGDNSISISFGAPKPANRDDALCEVDAAAQSDDHECEETEDSSSGGDIDQGADTQAQVKALRAEMEVAVIQAMAEGKHDQVSRIAEEYTQRIHDISRSASL